MVPAFLCLLLTYSYRYPPISKLQTSNNAEAQTEALEQEQLICKTLPFESYAMSIYEVEMQQFMLISRPSTSTKHYMNEPVMGLRDRAP